MEQTQSRDQNKRDIERSAEMKSNQVYTYSIESTLTLPHSSRRENLGTPLSSTRTMISTSGQGMWPHW